MIFDLNNLQIDLFKKFDGVNNYFNPSHFNGRTIFRRESKFEDKLLISDIVDDQDVVLLQNNTDDTYLWTYEDARFINENEISVCCCKRDKHDVEKIVNVEYKKYNLTTKEFTHFKTQNSHFEKHWQFYNDKIIYHVNPYIIFDSSENIIFKKQINWQPWVERYGNPGLSTNVFEVDKKKYIIYHSYKCLNGINLRYYCGILCLDDDLKPIAYTADPIFPSFDGYDREVYLSYFNWKRSLKSFPTVVDVLFPMNTIVNGATIEIYAGINDFISAKLEIDKDVYLNFIKNTKFILL